MSFLIKVPALRRGAGSPGPAFQISVNAASPEESVR
jgi:hypothetical protein